jgi:serine/threonine protein kinase
MGPDATNWEGIVLSAGRYRIDKRLGWGGEGCVYRAYDNNVGTHVVIKVPHGHNFSGPDFVARFTREIRLLVRLTHPHIVKILDVGEHQGFPFAVMQYLPGGNLRDRQPHDRDDQPLPMSLAEVVRWLGQVAQALDFIHQQGFIHRDVKPENILFDEHGNVYLSDFGVVKALATSLAANTTLSTHPGTVLGTPRYTSPEMIEGKPYDGRLDQYALAVSVWELLTGRTPFDGTSPATIHIMHLHHELPLLNHVVPWRKSRRSASRRAARSPKRC